MVLGPDLHVFERVAEVGVFGVAAVARPPARIDGQLHQVGEPPDLLRAGGFAARQRGEFFEVDRVGTTRFQVRVQEREVRELILGVVVDVLRHVFVEHFQRRGVRRTAASARNLAVLDAAELVVLLPEVGLQDLRGRQKPQDRGIGLAELRRRGPVGESARCPPKRRQAHPHAGRTRSAEEHRS